MLEVVFTEFLGGLASRDDVIDDHEQRMDQRHHGLPVPPPGSNAMAAGGQSRVFGVWRRFGTVTLSRAGASGCRGDGLRTPGESQGSVSLHTAMWVAEIVCASGRSPLTVGRHPLS